MIFFRLVKSGYGNLKEVMELNAEQVLQALNYESFLVDYQDAYLDIQK